jgi:hypothetical protein
MLLFALKTLTGYYKVAILFEAWRSGPGASPTDNGTIAGFCDQGDRISWLGKESSTAEEDCAYADALASYSGDPYICSVRSDINGASRSKW